MKYRVFLDTFSGSASDLKRGQRDAAHVLAALSKDPRVSTWDMSEHPWLRCAIAELERDGLIIDKDKKSFPWICYKLTAAGKAKIKEMVPE